MLHFSGVLMLHYYSLNDIDYQLGVFNRDIRVDVPKEVLQGALLMDR